MISKKVQAKIGARLAAAQALYLYAQGETSADDIVIGFMAGSLGREVIDEDSGTGEEHFVRLPDMDEAFFKTLFKYAVDNQAHIDEVIFASLDKKQWTPERLEQVLHAILRAGLAELMLDKDTDKPIIINEYINLARSFYDDGPEVGLTNAVLDKAAKTLAE